MASFFNHASTLDPALDDLASWGFRNNETGDSFAGIRDTAHPTTMSPYEPSTGPSIPGPGHAQSRMAKSTASKVANRFSSESVRILRQWLKDHESHPGQPPVDIPRRRPTPSPFESMNPLERWENSPPEHEPASVSDISRIVATTPASPATPYYLRGSDFSSSDASSVSSAGISRSSRGSGSSNHTDSLAKSLGTLKANRKKRRRIPRRQATSRTNLLQQCHTYQCTFCIETFKHKYDWQRHEKSLHLSLEKWVCSPTGPTALHPDLGLQVCVYCGAAEPGQSHVESHHHSDCQQRAITHRTFYRKDHLRQHLKLVHKSNFMAWPMEEWKTAGREIRSRCGFCDRKLETWNCRIDHLADHFKSGCTMAGWKGDWGFDAEILEIVDNDMPPYLIHYERISPLPISSMRGSPDTPPSAYELIKLELEYFTQDCLDTRGMLPLDGELFYDGCCIIFGADIISSQPASSAPSWLRDIFLCSEKSREARLLPLEQISKSRLSQLKINGKESIFDDCDLELELCRLVTMYSSVGVDMSDYQIQEEAANIISYVEAFSPRPSKNFADFIMRQIWGTTGWLGLFRERRRLLFKQDRGKGLDQTAIPIITDVGPGTPSQHIFPQQLQGNHIVGQEDHVMTFSPVTLPGMNMGGSLMTTPHHSTTNSPSVDQRLLPTSANVEPSQLQQNRKVPFLLIDHNSYTRLAAGLARFVTTTMSPHNPNRHIPTDKELQYQARWMWYDE
ncbi:hypothetical protein VDGE_30530 [Verticillium dahliae]|uniref:C2H2-type domain-containing protein n=1 Tax=Verticillium dahliae TaxID=27337 RepID=A0A444RKZ7_VERDA|nr:hypothetical protein VDGE_30530 [Verticillium dahliae]